MIRYHLTRLMDKHKMCISNVMRETSLSHTTITRLHKETTIKMDLDKLYKLFNCPLSVLLEQVPN